MNASPSFRVIRQDWQVAAVTWFLREPPKNRHAWAWTDNPDQAAPLSEIEAHRLAAQYNQRPAKVRHGTLAKAVPA